MFLKLTHASAEIPIYINSKYIVSMFCEKEGVTNIYLTTKLLYEVKESISEINEMLYK